MNKEDIKDLKELVAEKIESKIRINSDRVKPAGVPSLHPLL